MGGKPNKGTPADRRLKQNRSATPPTGKGTGGMKPMKSIAPKPMGQMRRGSQKH